jgi:hypothetical protein
MKTPQQLVINGLNYFLNANKDVKVGEPLAKISAPNDKPSDKPREPDGICFYLKCNLWWNEIPYHNRSSEETRLTIQTENLIDALIEPYIEKGQCYLSEKGILTAERLQVVSQLLSKLQGPTE